MERLVGRAKKYLKGGGLGPFLLRATAGSATVRISSTIASFGVSVLLARGLGVQGFGYYALAMSVITIAGILGLGLSKLVTREVAIASARDDNSALFGVLRWADRTCWILSSVIVVAVAVAAIVLISHGSTPLGWVLLFGAPVIPLIALARLRGGAMQGLRHIVVGQLPANLIRPLLFALLLGTFLLSFGHLDPVSAMALNSVAAAAVFVIAHLLLRARLPQRAPPEVAKTARKWLGSSIPLALNDVMRTLQGELTLLLIGLYLTPADVALVRVSLLSAVLAAVPMTILARVNMPMIAKLYAEGDIRRLQKLCTYSAYAQTAGVALFALPLIAIPELLLSSVFGESYAPAAEVVRIIAIGQLANAAFGPNGMVLNMTHHEGRVTRAMTVALILNIAAVLLLLSAGFGIIGAAVGFVVSLLSWNVLTWLDGRRILSIDTSVLGQLLPVRARLA